MKKTEARDILFTLVYESEFDREKSAAEIYENAREERGFEPFRYIKKGLSDITSNRDTLAGIIERRAEGWSVYRIAPVTRSILLVAAYEMVFKSTPCGIVINEAVELAKKYDDESAAPFVNGILNTVAKEIEIIQANEIPKPEAAEDAASPEESVAASDEE